jgi:anti-sigma regulatory factor (Ser/Thr protein kinase)
MSLQHDVQIAWGEVAHPVPNGTRPSQTGETGTEFLVLPSKMQSLQMLRRVVIAACRRCGADEAACDDFALAVTEAFSNAVRHGSSQPGDRVEAWIRAGRGACSVILQYPGDPFVVDAPRLPGDFSTSGRGRYLMSMLSDQVDYAFQNGLTRVRLRKQWD